MAILPVTEETGQVALPMESDSAHEGHLREAAVDQAVTNMGWIWRNPTRSDCGIDGTIEYELIASDAIMILPTNDQVPLS